MNKDDLTELRDLALQYFEWCKRELGPESGDPAWNEAKLAAGFLECVAASLEDEEDEEPGE